MNPSPAKVNILISKIWLSNPARPLLSGLMGIRSLAVIPLSVSHSTPHLSPELFNLSAAPQHKYLHSCSN
jgi:hypothetical protein